MAGEPAPQLQNDTVRRAIITRYGDPRSAILRVLYSWLNLTMLMILAWPALVVFVDAPDTDPQDTPLDWFLVRLGILIGAAALLARFWYVNQVPTNAIRLASMTALFRRGKIWPQVIFFLLALTAVLAVILLARDPAAAVKILTLGGVSAALVQVLNAGYIYGLLDVLGVERSRVTGLVVALFGVTFAGQAAINAGIATGSQTSDIVVGFVAGAVLGVLAGAISLLLRTRSGSLAPAFLTQWLVFSIVPAFF